MAASPKLLRNRDFHIDYLGDAQWCRPTNETFLPDPEDVELTVRYLMPDKLGRLYVRAQPAIRNSDHKEIIQLTLTARGRPNSPDPATVFEWFDRAQLWTGKAFVDFTSQKMHSVWGMRNEP